MTSRELAGILGIVPETVRVLTRKKVLDPAEVTPAGHYLYSVEDCRAAMDARRHVRGTGVRA